MTPFDSHKIVFFFLQQRNDQNAISLKFGMVCNLSLKNLRMKAEQKQRIKEEVVALRNCAIFLKVFTLLPSHTCELE